MSDLAYKSKLNRELIRHIFANVGAVPGPDFGKFGLIRPEFKSKETLDFEYEGNEKFKCPIYSGKLLFENAEIKSVFVNLSLDPNQEEYALVFQNGINPIYGVRLFIADSNDDGLFMIFSGEKWTNISTITKCRALIGFEMIASHGLSWNFSSENQDLTAALGQLATIV